MDYHCKVFEVENCQVLIYYCSGKGRDQVVFRTVINKKLFVVELDFKSFDEAFEVIMHFGESEASSFAKAMTLYNNNEGAKANKEMNNLNLFKQPIARA